MLFNCCVCVRVYLALQELTLEMNLIVERLSAVEERTEPKKHARSDEGITFLACLVCTVAILQLLLASIRSTAAAFSVSKRTFSAIKI